MFHNSHEFAPGGAVTDTVYYTTAEVERILGLKWAAIRSNFPQRRLPAEPRPDLVHALRVGHESLTALVSKLIENGDPEEWIRDCLAIPQRLISQQEAAEYMLQSPGEIRHKIKALPHLVLRGRHELRLPVDGMLQLIEEEPLTTADVAHYFDVKRRIITNWKRAGRLRCTAHYHVQPSDEPATGSTVITYRACFAHLLLKCSSPGLRPRQWMYGIDISQRPQLNTVQTAELLGVGTDQVIEWAKRGWLKGVHEPRQPDRWHFTQNRVERFRARCLIIP